MSNDLQVKLRKELKQNKQKEHRDPSAERDVLEELMAQQQHMNPASKNSTPLVTPIKKSFTPEDPKALNVHKQLDNYENKEGKVTYNYDHDPLYNILHSKSNSIEELRANNRQLQLQIEHQAKVDTENAKLNEENNQLRKQLLIQDLTMLQNKKAEKSARTKRDASAEMPDTTRTADNTIRVNIDTQEKILKDNAYLKKHVKKAESEQNKVISELNGKIDILSDKIVLGDQSKSLNDDEVSGLFADFKKLKAKYLRVKNEKADIERKLNVQFEEQVATSNQLKKQSETNVSLQAELKTKNLKIMDMQTEINELNQDSFIGRSESNKVVEEELTQLKAKYHRDVSRINLKNKDIQQELDMLKTINLKMTNMCKKYEYTTQQKTQFMERNPEKSEKEKEIQLLFKMEYKQQHQCIPRKLRTYSVQTADVKELESEKVDVELINLRKEIDHINKSQNGLMSEYKRNKTKYDQLSEQNTKYSMYFLKLKQDNINQIIHNTPKQLNNSSQFKDLKSKVAASEGEVETLRNRVSSRDNEILENRKTINRLRFENSSLRSDMQAVQMKLQQSEDGGTNSSNLKVQYENLSYKYKEVSKDYDVLKNKSYYIYNENEYLQGKIKDLETKKTDQDKKYHI